MKKYTEWFPASTDPVRIGYYEVRCKRSSAWGRGTLVFWNGTRWVDVSRAFKWFARNVKRSCDQWRGLAKPPNESP